MRNVLEHAVLVVVIVLLVFSISGYYGEQREETGEVTYTPDYSTTLFLPAVDQSGNGVHVSLIVETKNGRDRILTNIDKLVFWTDTQGSIQTAKSVAKNITGVDTNDIDIIYTIEGNNATLVGGPSAGAGLTIATISVLKQKPLRKDVMITGTIEKNRTIGKVGGIEEKAKAAKEAGVSIFLIPEGALGETKTKVVESCERTEKVTYCETAYKEVEFNLSREVGIEVKEIKTIEEAMEYFDLV